MVKRKRNSTGSGALEATAADSKRAKKDRRHTITDIASTLGSLAHFVITYPKKGRDNKQVADVLTQPLPFKISRARKSVQQYGEEAVKIKPHELLEVVAPVDYIAKPAHLWAAMRPYNNFIIGDETYHTGDYVYVSDGRAGARQSATDFWIARVLQVRAESSEHVFALVRLQAVPLLKLQTDGLGGVDVLAT